MFVPQLEAALGDIERVTVVKANGETVATLERRPENWVAADKNDYVADAAKLRQALTTLSDARILEQKTANPELYARLGVEDVEAADAAGLRVAFTAQGQELPTVILGNARLALAEVEIGSGRHQTGQARRREVESAARAKGLALLARQAAVR